MIITDKYYLVYDGGDYIMSGYATGELSSNHTIETFTTPELIVSRASTLSLTMVDRDGVTRELETSDFPS
jgi:hypothetical protein